MWYYGLAVTAEQTMSNDSENERAGLDASPRHAGVWVRVAANVIDLFVFGVPLFLLGTALLGAEPAKDDASIADLYDAQFLLNLVIVGAITILLWVNWDGRTPGKKTPLDTDHNVPRLRYPVIRDRHRAHAT